MYDISVVIPCYNGNATLGQELEGLSRQVGAPSFEVVVVDNMSSIPPDDVVAQWQGSVPNLRIVRADEGQGISAARNVGVREARSERIALCDADDVVGPHFVRAAYEGLDVADFVTGNVVTVDARNFSTVDEAWSFLPDIDAETPAVLGLVDPRYPIMMGGACALTREAVIALHGYDQAYFPGVEDNDFSLRALAAGYSIATSEAMTLAERRRADNAGAFRRSYDAGRMHIKLCKRHDLWSASPHLHDPEWWFDLIKLPLAALRMGARPASVRDGLALASRAGLRLGQLRGMVEYKVLGRAAGTCPGVGLFQAGELRQPTTQ